MKALAADCAHCVALCCLALAFDKGEKFAHDKAAGAACTHLTGHACSIHADLDAKGYRGCVAYDCAGAGQRVTALFARSWRDEPALAGPMMAAFAAMREVQELRQMLAASHSLPLSPETCTERSHWDNILETVSKSLEALDSFDPTPIRAWLRSLAGQITRGA